MVMYDDRPVCKNQCGISTLINQHLVRLIWSEFLSISDTSACFDLKVFLIVLRAHPLCPCNCNMNGNHHRLWSTENRLYGMTTWYDNGVTSIFPGGTLSNCYAIILSHAVIQDSFARTGSTTPWPSSGILVCHSAGSTQLLAGPLGLLYSGVDPLLHNQHKLIIMRCSVMPCVKSHQKTVKMTLLTDCICNFVSLCKITSTCYRYNPHC
jgi:hypothetical protein